LAGRFSAEITVSADGEWVSARSVLSLLSLAASRGTRLKIRACGGDAVEAVEALGRLLEHPPEYLPEPGSRD
jgi:phosphocarrier protein